MAVRARHRPLELGCEGLMHWRAHVKAFQMQWVLCYLDPRKAPWKDVLDHWIASKYHVGRKIVMVPHAPGSKTLESHLPPRLKYLRTCFREFQQLPLRQDISTPPPSVAAETLFTNPRFTITLRDQSAFLWKEHVQVSTIVDLIDRDSGVTFTDDEWEAHFYELAPDPDAGHAHNFARNRAAGGTERGGASTRRAIVLSLQDDASSDRGGE